MTSVSVILEALFVMCHVSTNLIKCYSLSKGLRPTMT